MGAESGGDGGGGASPVVKKSAGDVPPDIMIFKQLFLDKYKQICIFRHFQNKVAQDPRRN